MKLSGEMNMKLSAQEKKTGMILRIIREVLILYEFSRLLFVYPEGDYLILIHGLFALAGIFSLVIDIRKDPKIFRTPQAIFSAVILFVAAFSTYCSIGTLQKILPEWFLQLAWFSLFLHISDRLYTRKQLLREVRTINFMILILTFIGTALSLLGYGLSLKGIDALGWLPVDTTYMVSGRFWGLYRWPTIVGIMSLIAIIESLMHFRKATPGFRVFLILNLVMQMYAMYLARSRAPMIALVAVLLVCVIYAFLHIPNKMAGVALLLLLAVGIGATAVIFMQRGGLNSATADAYQKYLNSLPDQNAPYAMSYQEFQIDALSSTRVRTWKAAIAATSTMPFLLRGWGITNFNNIVGWVFPGLSQNFPDLMHDMFVQSFLDTGLIGLISFVSLIVLNIRSGMKVIRQRHSDELFGMFLILIAIGVYCCFDLGIWFRKWFYSGIFWLFSGYFWWLCRYEKRINSRDN